MRSTLGLQHPRHHRRELPDAGVRLRHLRLHRPAGHVRVATGARTAAGSSCRSSSRIPCGSGASRRRSAGSPVPYADPEDRRASSPSTSRARKRRRGGPSTRRRAVELTDSFRTLGIEPVIVGSEQSRRGALGVSALGRSPGDGAGSPRMRRLLPIAAALLCAFPAGICRCDPSRRVLGNSDRRKCADSGVRVCRSRRSSSSATMSPQRSTVLVDRTVGRAGAAPTPSWPSRPSSRSGRRRGARASHGRVIEIQWTWTLRCVTAACVPVVPPSDLVHIFHLPPAAQSTYIGRERKARVCGRALDSRRSRCFPRSAPAIIAVSGSSTRRSIGSTSSRRRLSPTGSRPRSCSGSRSRSGASAPAPASHSQFAAVVRHPVPPAPAAAHTPPQLSPLERALALFFWAGRRGDETLQRKALERVAAELPLDVADLSDATRELAWSPETARGGRGRGDLRASRRTRAPRRTEPANERNDAQTGRRATRLGDLPGLSDPAERTTLVSLALSRSGSPPPSPALCSWRGSAGSGRAAVLPAGDKDGRHRDGHVRKRRRAEVRAGRRNVIRSSRRQRTRPPASSCSPTPRTSCCLRTRRRTRSCSSSGSSPR